MIRMLRTRFLSNNNVERKFQLIQNYGLFIIVFIKWAIVIVQNIKLILSLRNCELKKSIDNVPQFDWLKYQGQ